MYTHTHGCTSFITYIQQMLVFLPSFLTATVYNPLSTVNKSFTLQATPSPSMLKHTYTQTHNAYCIYSYIQCALFYSFRRFNTLQDSKQK